MNRYAVHYEVVTPIYVNQATAIINAESDAEARIKFFLQTDIADSEIAISVRIIEVICMGEVS